MKRALQVKKEPVAPAKKGKEKAIVPVRICLRPGCGKQLKNRQKAYCSHEHRALELSPGNKGGGVSKYKPEFSAATFKAYLDKIDKGNEPTLIPTESSYIVIHNAAVPTIDDYAEFLEVHPDSLVNWGRAYPDFARVLDRILRLQKQLILNNGLAGRYNSTIAKLALNVNHGMVEKSQVDNTHKLIGVVKHVYARADEMEKQDNHGA